jgi:hypothetical protein
MIKDQNRPSGGTYASLFSATSFYFDVFGPSFLLSSTQNPPKKSPAAACYQLRWERLRLPNDQR